MIQAELGSVCIDYTNPLFCAVQVYERKQRPKAYSDIEAIFGIVVFLNRYNCILISAIF